MTAIVRTISCSCSWAILGVALAGVAAIGCGDDETLEPETVIDRTEPTEHQTLPADPVHRSLLDETLPFSETTPPAEPNRFHRDLSVPARHRMTLPADIR